MSQMKEQVSRAECEAMLKAADRILQYIPQHLAGALLDVLESLRKDKERLDWCDREMVITYPSQRKPGNTLRQTIDEKMLEHKTWLGLQPDAARSAPENGAASNAPAPAGQTTQLERERELADQLAAALKDLMKYSAWVSVTSAKCEDALAQYAAMRAKESSSTAEQSHPQSSTTS